MGAASSTAAGQARVRAGRASGSGPNPRSDPTLPPGTGGRTAGQEDSHEFTARIRHHLNLTGFPTYSVIGDRVRQEPDDLDHDLPRSPSGTGGRMRARPFTAPEHGECLLLAVAPPLPLT